MAPSSIAPQDPSMSPTYAMSTNQSQQIATGSIRRNLFAGHLSRRPPATSAQNPFESPVTVPEDQSQHNVFSSVPTIQPQRRGLGFNDIYDPDGSPPPLTQSSAQTGNGNQRESIVALHPVTGRPLLPTIPTLPPRLRLSEGDENEEEMSDLEHEQHRVAASQGFSRSSSYHGGLNHMSKEFELEEDVDLDSSELDRLSTYHNPSGSIMKLNVNHFLDMTSEESRADGERIEYLLLEMASRQRARARTITNPNPSTLNAKDASHAGSHGPTVSNTSQSSGASALPSSRRRAGAAGGPFTNGAKQSFLKQSQQDASSQQADPHTHAYQPSYARSKDPATLPVGQAIDPLEKEELVSLIMTSLRRKVATADEESWMYGVRDGMGFGMDTIGPESESFE